MFSCYIKEYVDFVPFSGALGGGGGDAYVWPPWMSLWRSWLTSPHHWLIRRCIYLQILKTISEEIISKKYMQILPCIGNLYHRFQQNVPESESRQFDRLRLRLLARCHDSRLLRLQLRLRIPGSILKTALVTTITAYLYFWPKTEEHNVTLTSFTTDPS